MKSLLIAALLFASSAFAHPMSHETAAVHGMLLFGKKTIYLNHLAMFHPPHDRQVIFAVTVSDPKAYEQLRAQTEKDGAIMTVVPEPFVLTQMILSPHPFKGRVFAGHFERGGREAIAEMTFTIQKIIYSQQLPTPATRVSEIEFGDAEEMYSAHRITNAPDFDRILSVDLKKEIYKETDDFAD